MNKFEKITKNKSFIFLKWYNNYRIYFWTALFVSICWIVLVCIGIDLMAENKLAPGVILFLFGFCLLVYNIYEWLLVADSIKPQAYRTALKQHYAKKLFSLDNNLQYLALDVAILDYNLFRRQF